MENKQPRIKVKMNPVLYYPHVRKDVKKNWKNNF